MQAGDQPGIVAEQRDAIGQRFLPGGPLAFLPVDGERRSSIVWSLPEDEATRVLALDDAAAEIVIAEVAGRPEIFVNPYAVEVQDRTPSGRDRLKERIRSAGPTVGHSVAGGVG